MNKAAGLTDDHDTTHRYDVASWPRPKLRVLLLIGFILDVNRTEHVLWPSLDFPPMSDAQKRSRSKRGRHQKRWKCDSGGGAICDEWLKVDKYEYL